MSIVKPKNFSYIRGPKGDKGDRGEPGSGVAGATGRITYNSATKVIGFNEAGLATTSYVNNSINNLTNGAPLLLDTLNELSAAIGNNPNFITDVTASIASKLSLTGGTLTGALILSSNPSSNLEAATKQYVDNATSSIVISYDDLTDKPALFSGSYTDLTNKPALFGGSYNDLTNKPALFGGSYNDLTNKPALFSGSYTDLTNKPTTANISESGNLYFTTERARASISVSGDLNYNNSTGVISLTIPAGFSGSYNDLTNKPDLFDSNYNNLNNKPFIPTNINGLCDVDTSTVAPSVGDTLIWDGTNWIPGASVASIISNAALDSGEF